jgi:hypothetical protein
MPKTIKAALVILWIQIALATSILIGAFVTVTYKAKHGFWLGFQDRIAAAGNAPSLADYGAYHAGRISGSIFISLVLLAASLWSIKDRCYRIVVVCSTLLVLMSLNQQSTPILSFAVLALVSVGTGRAWLKREELLNDKTA